MTGGCNCPQAGATRRAQALARVIPPDGWTPDCPVHNICDPHKDGSAGGAMAAPDGSGARAAGAAGRRGLPLAPGGGRLHAFSVPHGGGLPDGHVGSSSAVAPSAPPSHRPPATFALRRATGSASPRRSRSSVTPRADREKEQSELEDSVELERELANQREEKYRMERKRAAELKHRLEHLYPILKRYVSATSTHLVV